MKKTIISSIVGISVLGTALYAPNTNATQNNTCVDGRDRTKLSWVFNKPNDVTVSVKNNAPLCEAIDMYFSSYTLPDNYNGEGFRNNPTATPQTEYAHTKFTLKKGVNEPVNVVVDRPDECKHIQTDVYYPPIIRTVGPSGHPDILIGKIFSKTVDECAPVTPEEPETPEVPETPETPEVPETPVEEPEQEGRVDAGGEGKAEAPQVIAATGAGSLLTLGAITSVLAYAGTYLGRK